MRQWLPALQARAALSSYEPGSARLRWQTRSGARRGRKSATTTQLNVNRGSANPEWAAPANAIPCETAEELSPRSCEIKAATELSPRPIRVQVLCGHRHALPGRADFAAQSTHPAPPARGRSLERAWEIQNPVPKFLALASEFHQARSCGQQR